jgi:hypothetical protein
MKIDDDKDIVFWDEDSCDCIAFGFKGRSNGSFFMTSN